MSARSLAIVAALGAILVAPSASVPRAQDSPLFAAMQDEMKRSMTELRLKGEPAPYYIEYEIDETVQMRAVGRFGALVDELTSHGRALRVQVRVGDYGFDSSRFITQVRGAGVVPLANGGVTAPLDDDYDAIRRQIWLTTDAAYKRAVSVYARKKATFQNRAATDALPDFSQEAPVETVLPGVTAAPRDRVWFDRARELSAVFLSNPDLSGGEAWLSETRGTSYYLNSEGFKTVAPIEAAYLRAAAEAQAGDGMPVRDMFTIVESRLEDMPPMSELTARAKNLAASVSARRVAEIGDEFTGPVLLEGQASAEFLRQTLVPLLLARRPADTDQGFGRGGGGQAQVTPFLTRIGLRVMADSFSVSDTPSLKQFDGQTVAGAYVVDDEAVRAKDVTLVDKGRLLTLLTSRTPQRKLLQSNGHGRGGGAQAGVVQVRSAQAVPAAELKARYLELLKTQDLPFGYIVRAVASPGDVPGGGPGGPVMLEAVKVTPDGREEPVRGLRFGNTPSTAFRDILDASEERVLHNYRINGVTPGSIIAPSLIFEELEVQRTREIVQNPPVVPSPFRN
jgi:predicted Zn-dependent protease